MDTLDPQTLVDELWLLKKDSLPPGARTWIAGMWRKPHVPLAPDQVRRLWELHNRMFKENLDAHTL